MKPYYQEDGITIYHGDCREVLPILPHLDLILTDPPYGVEFTGKVTKRRTEGNGYSQFADTPEYVESVIVPVVVLCLKLADRVIVMPGHRNMLLYPRPDDIGCIFNPAPAGRGPWGFTCFNPILYYGQDPYIKNGLGGSANGFSELQYPQFPLGAGDGIKGHPCPKPLRWMRWLVKKGSLAGELVGDPFMGSGTTLEASKLLGRRAIGIEIEERYCEIAAKRLSQCVLQLSEPAHLENGEKQDIFPAWA